MQRIPLTPSPDWQTKVESESASPITRPRSWPRRYWDESACYEFASAEVDMLEATANTMQEMCLAAAQNVIDGKNSYAQLDIPSDAVPVIEAAWNAEPPALYGRFDFELGQTSGQAPKLLEYNADTPTSLLEAAVVQWYWLEDVGSSLPSSHSVLSFLAGKADQFNSIHERLIAKWKDIEPYLEAHLLRRPDNPKTILTLTYLRDTAQQAGLATPRSPWKTSAGMTSNKPSLTLNEDHMLSIFQALPLGGDDRRRVRSPRHRHIPTCTGSSPSGRFSSPTKAFCPSSRQLYPKHELLLEAHFDTTSNHPARLRPQAPLLPRGRQHHHGPRQRYHRRNRRPLPRPPT